MKLMRCSSNGTWITLFTSVLLLTSACASDDADDETPTDTTQIADNGPEEQTTGPEDIFIPEPGPGFAPPGKAEAQHDDECKDITECTSMSEPEGGGCYCAYCGWKGIDMKCIQVLCPPAN